MTEGLPINPEEAGLESAEDKEFELAPEIEAMVMEKVQDIDEPGILYHTMSGMRDIQVQSRLESVLLNGILIPSSFVSAHNAREVREDYLERVKKMRQTKQWKGEYWDNRSSADAPFFGTTYFNQVFDKDIRGPESESATQISNDPWIKKDVSENIGFTFRGDHIREYDWDNPHFNGEVRDGDFVAPKQGELNDALTSGRRFIGRIAPRKLTGCYFILREPLEEADREGVRKNKLYPRIEAFNESSPISFEMVNDKRKELDGNSKPEEIDALIKFEKWLKSLVGQELYDEYYDLVDLEQAIDKQKYREQEVVDPEKLNVKANEISKIMLEVDKDHIDRLIPIYDTHGNLWWPRQMSHEGVKQFVAEREESKQEAKQAEQPSEIKFQPQIEIDGERKIFRYPELHLAFEEREKEFPEPMASETGLHKERVREILEMPPVLAKLRAMYETDEIEASPLESLSDQEAEALVDVLRILTNGQFPSYYSEVHAIAGYHFGAKNRFIKEGGHLSPMIYKYSRNGEFDSLELGLQNRDPGAGTFRNGIYSMSDSGVPKEWSFDLWTSLPFDFFQDGRSLMVIINNHNPEVKKYCDYFLANLDTVILDLIKSKNTFLEHPARPLNDDEENALRETLIRIKNFLADLDSNTDEMKQYLADPEKLLDSPDKLVNSLTYAGDEAYEQLFDAILNQERGEISAKGVLNDKLLDDLSAMFSSELQSALLNNYDICTLPSTICHYWLMAKGYYPSLYIKEKENKLGSFTNFPVIASPQLGTPRWCNRTSMLIDWGNNKIRMFNQ